LVGVGKATNGRIADLTAEVGWAETTWFKWRHLARGKKGQKLRSEEKVRKKLGGSVWLLENCRGFVVGGGRRLGRR